MYSFYMGIVFLVCVQAFVHSGGCVCVVVWEWRGCIKYFTNTSFKVTSATIDYFCKRLEWGH